MFHVKPLSPKEQQSIAALELAARSLGLEIGREETERLLLGLLEVLEANKTTNLTAITDWDAAVRLHLLDSLSCLPEILDSPRGRVADLGSGAGYPGIPLALLLEERSFTLVESVGKKARFLEGLIRDLDLESRVSVRAVRAEELALAEPGGFAVVTARALSSLPSLLELASPLLQESGRLIALKSNPGPEELESAQVAGGLTGMRARGQRNLVLPGGDEQRSILVYERHGKSSTRLPRRPGMAQRKPLA